MTSDLSVRRSGLVGTVVNWALAALCTALCLRFVEKVVGIPGGVFPAAMIGGSWAIGTALSLRRWQVPVVRMVRVVAWFNLTALWVGWIVAVGMNVFNFLAAVFVAGAAMWIEPVLAHREKVRRRLVDTWAPAAVQTMTNVTAGGGVSQVRGVTGDVRIGGREVADPDPVTVRLVDVSERARELFGDAAADFAPGGDLPDTDWRFEIRYVTPEGRTGTQMVARGATATEVAALISLSRREGRIR